jgi:hypothetical protein
MVEKHLKIGFLTSSFAVAGILISTPANATLLGFSSCTGALNCSVTTSPPNPVTPNPNNGLLLGWDEVQNLTLSSDLKVDRVFDTDASFVKVENGNLYIKAGTIVSSHYLQWDPSNNSSSRVSATINLDSQAFAFITSDQNLFDSDAALGLPGLDYNDFTLRGLEGNDVTVFDGNNVNIDWRAGNPGDWTRLITAFSPGGVNPKPIPTPALLPGLIGMGVAALRKRKQEAEAEA